MPRIAVSMTEVERVARLLSRRVTATGMYKVSLPEDPHAPEHGGFFLVTIHLLDAEVMVYLEPEGDSVQGALSFILPHGKGNIATHLNGWRRAPVPMTVPQLVNALWAAFWEHEQENKELGRILWMHGPTLPSLPEDVPVQGTLFLPSTDSVLDLLADVGNAPPQKRKKPLLVPEEDIFALFGLE